MGQSDRLSRRQISGSQVQAGRVAVAAVERSAAEYETFSVARKGRRQIGALEVRPRQLAARMVTNESKNIAHGDLASARSGNASHFESGDQERNGGKTRLQVDWA